MELLEQLLTKVSVARKAVEFCKGDREATNAVINSIYLEVGDIQRSLQDLKNLVAKLRLLQSKANFFALHFDLIKGSCIQISSNLPKRLVTAQPRENVKVGNKKNGTESSQLPSNKSKTNGTVPKVVSDVQIPVLQFPTMDQFENIPKYMKGRLSYDGLNSAIEEYNVALLSKYNFLKRGFPATGSMADKKKFKELRTQETKDTKGVYFVVAEDLRSGACLKSETNRRTIFPMLRHLQMTREIRGPGSIVRFAVV